MNGATANSTPDKAEAEDKIEIEDLGNILDEPKKRFMKSKQLALEIQRSSECRQATQSF